MRNGIRRASALAVLMAGLPALAQDAGQDMFKVRGFLTLAATQSSEKNADFVSNFAQPNGPGFTRSLDFGVDSRAGLQLDGKFTEQLSAVVQVVSEHRYDNHFEPYINMANLKFEALPGLSFRLGRMPFSAYHISDYQKVGYSTPWVRPPVEVYQFNPLSNFDGADAVIQHNVGSVALSWQLLGGSSTAKLASNQVSEFKAKGMVAASVAATYGSSTWRAYYLQLKGSLNNTGLDSASGPYAILRAPLIPYPPFGLVPNPYYNPTAADQYQIKDDRITYASVGYNYDPGDWFLLAEATRNAGDEDQLLHATAAYATVGIRFGAWTPYATLATKKTDSPISNANPIVNAIISSSNQAQSSTSLGLRWDFRANTDLKLQVDRVKNATGSVGALVNTQPGFQPGGSYTLLSASLDFVF